MDDTFEDAYYTYGTDDVDEAERRIRAAVPGVFIDRHLDFGAGLAAGRPDKSGAIIVFRGARRNMPEVKTPLDEVIRFLRKEE